jgi:hypothetical protein
MSESGGLGPAVAVEFTPIKHWLEIEIGTGPLFGSGMTDWSTDFFSKAVRSFRHGRAYSRRRPAFDSTFGGGTEIRAEFALDFMFWPWPHRMYGWFLELSYTYGFINGREQSFGVSVGVLIAIR